MKIMVTSFKSSRVCTATLSSPNPAEATTNPHLCWRLLDIHLESLGQTLVWSLLLSPGSWCARSCLCPPRVYFPVLCKFWQLYGGVNGDLLQEGLCHTQVCCTQSPCPCGSLLLTCASSGMLKYSSVSVGSLGPGVLNVCLNPFSGSGRNRV